MYRACESPGMLPHSIFFSCSRRRRDIRSFETKVRIRTCMHGLSIAKVIERLYTGCPVISGDFTRVKMCRKEKMNFINFVFNQYLNLFTKNLYIILNLVNSPIKKLKN